MSSARKGCALARGVSETGAIQRDRILKTAKFRRAVPGLASKVPHDFLAPALSTFCAGASPRVPLIDTYAFEARHDSVLGRGVALPLGGPPGAGPGRRGDAGRAMAAAEAAVPPQPCEHLLVGRRRRLDRRRLRLRQRGLDCGLDRA